MTWVDWLCLLGIVLLLAFLVWFAGMVSGQEAPPPVGLPEAQLERIEQKLDAVLEQERGLEEAAEPKGRKRRPAKRPRRGRPPPPTPPPEPVPLELPRLEETLTVPEEPPPGPCCRWTWGTIDARRAVRETAQGD